jgi:hypothetical protein
MNYDWTLNAWRSCLVHGNNENVNDGKNEQEQGTDVIQVVNLALLELLVEVDSGGIHKNKT